MVYPAIFFLLTILSDWTGRNSNHLVVMSVIDAIRSWECINIRVVWLADLTLVQTKIVDFFRIQRSSQPTEKLSPGKQHLLVTISYSSLEMLALDDVCSIFVLVRK